jgi:sugar/nucleoside kinase (ribokinase family)
VCAGEVDGRLVSGDLDLLVLGDVNPDLVLSDPELEVGFGQVETLVEEAALTIGGSGAIMACAAARLGLRTAIAGVVGDDLFGSFMREELVARGVDTSAVVVDPACRTGLTVVLARPGDRAIITHSGAITALAAEAVDRALLHRARHVHVASYFLQIALWPGLGELLASARRTGATTSLDPNWDPRETWDSGLPGLLGELDMLLPNAAEALALAGANGAPALSADAQIERAARTLAAAGPLVAVKCGARGALAVGSDGEVVRAASPDGVVAVDAVGAGDTFDAGLIAGVLGGDSIADALSLACACGTLSTRAAGGTAAQPTLAEARAAARR